MSHHHDHTGHVHAPDRSGRIFAIAIGLNVALVVLQVAFGFISHSVALIADAGHNFGDVLGLVLAWGAHALSRWTPTTRFTYGYRPASILAALLNAVLLLVATGAIVWEAIGRLMVPGEVTGMTVIIVAALAMAVNGLSAWLLMAGARRDLNLHGAFLHMVADAGVSFGVVVAGAGIVLTGWQWLDPAASLVISAVIVWGTWDLLREAIRLSLLAVPAGIDPSAVRRYFEALPGVAEVHDLHIWAMSTSETALTCHLIMPGGHPGDTVLASIAHDLQVRFGIAHPTMQIELSRDIACALAPEHLV